MNDSSRIWRCLLIILIWPIAIGGSASRGDDSVDAKVDHLLARSLSRTSDITKEEQTWLNENSEAVIDFLTRRLGQTFVPVYRALEAESVSEGEVKARPMLVILRCLENQRARHVEQAIVRVHLGILAQLRNEKALAVVAAAAEEDLLYDEVVRLLAEQNPSILLRKLDVKKPDFQVVEELARARVPEVIPWLERFLKASNNGETKDLARLWLMVARGKNPREGYPKSTPEEMLQSYAQYLRRNPKAIKDEEEEFWTYPGLFENSWKEFKKRLEKEKKERETLVENILLISESLNSKKVEMRKASFRGEEAVIVRYNGKPVVSMKKDVFDQWRFSPASEIQ